MTGRLTRRTIGGVNKSRPSQQKRQRERQRQERQKEKQAKRQEAAAQKANTPSSRPNSKGSSPGRSHCRTGRSNRRQSARRRLAFSYRPQVSAIILIDSTFTFGPFTEFAAPLVAAGSST